MKTPILLCFLVICGGAATAQQMTADPYSLARVKGVMDRQSLGIIFGFDAKAIPTLGDRCAIAILKIVDEPDLAQPKTLKGILRTIHLAFTRPQLIQIEEDRKPKVTLFFLNYVGEKTRDPEMHRMIEETTEFVRQQGQMDTSPSAPNTE